VAKTNAEITPYRKFILKNAMLATVTAVTVLVIIFLYIIEYYHFSSFGPQRIVAREFLKGAGADLAVLVAGLLILVYYERPIRRYVDMRVAGDEISPDFTLTAQRRLLNEPLFVAKLLFLVWVVEAVFYVVISLEWGMDWPTIRLNMGDQLHAIILATVLMVAAMILLQQRHLATFFFPGGKLYLIPGTTQFSYRHRFVVLLLALNVLPLMSIIRTMYRVMHSDLTPEAQMQAMVNAIWFIVPVSIAVGIVLVLLAAGNTIRTIQDVVGGLRRVANGDFSGRVPVSSNDEIGYAADVINDMTQGLKERQRLQHSLELAREVQQSLLPKTTPLVPGLDVAGRSLYCEGTGGDYYDYLLMDIHGGERLGVMVGDVSDHGIQSALLMATSRAFLRQKARLVGDAANVVYDVNQELCRDVKDSGYFMTLFFGIVNPMAGVLQYVSAGHDPAITYHPAANRFGELSGNGPALGLMNGHRYAAEMYTLVPGEIILIGTDGIWEAKNTHGEMFGKEALRKVLAELSSLPARDIVDGVIKILLDYVHPGRIADDVTLMVLKVAGDDTAKARAEIITQAGT
jgi:sigma-B regulation protein RsbU (phosphoserine phosphatase)